MDAKRNIKIARSMLYACTGALTIVALVPETALAAGGQWDVDSMLEKGGQTAGISVTTVTAETITQWVNRIVSWAIGIFVAFFVLRIALTAFDRMVLANSNSNAHVPFAYPNPGDERYDPNDIKGNTPPEGWTWKRIWINFGKNIAIVAGAWVLVQLVMGIVSMVMSNVVTQS